MTVDEQVLMFECGGEPLVGVLSGTPHPATRGVLIVVGGPQYRGGSHRQFTLLARHLAERGVPAMRFDYRGMGDSGGKARTFEHVGADIRCAIDRFFGSVPSLRDVVIWGLCDAASAALFYAHEDARVSGLVLLNPWVHTEQGEARAYLRHYYVTRLFQSGLWRKVARGEFSLHRAAGSLGKMLMTAMGRGHGSPELATPGTAPLPERMEDGLRRFDGNVLLILSGNDLVAREFGDLVAVSAGWRRLLDSEKVARHDLPQANHTFARREWRDQVARWTEDWVRSF